MKIKCTVTVARSHVLRLQFVLKDAASFRCWRKSVKNEPILVTFRQALRTKYSTNEIAVPSVCDACELYIPKVPNGRFSCNLFYTTL